MCLKLSQRHETALEIQWHKWVIIVYLYEFISRDTLSVFTDKESQCLPLKCTRHSETYGLLQLLTADSKIIFTIKRVKAILYWSYIHTETTCVPVALNGLKNHGCNANSKWKNILTRRRWIFVTKLICYLIIWHIEQLWVTKMYPS